MTNTTAPPDAHEDLLRPIGWTGSIANGYVWMIDQRRLPAEEVNVNLHAHSGVADAIRDMVIRGAPAIGVAAAFGAVLAARESLALPAHQQDAYFVAAMERLGSARPTAVNLRWALRRLFQVHQQNRELHPRALLSAMHHAAETIQRDDTAANLAMGKLGAALLPDNARVLTHCNTGALATSAYGTALGVIRSGWASGKVSQVYADETRPYLQGARLTAWELMRDDIPVTVITDSMAGHMMKEGLVDCVIVGSDRIARNGDVANKIGTYSVAVLAQYHGIPFYVVAPVSTIDLDTPTGAGIPIEERSAREVTHVGGHAIAPEGVVVRHPAFDVTPAALVTAIITETGVAQPVTEEAVVALASPK